MIKNQLKEQYNTLFSLKFYSFIPGNGGTR